MSWAGATDSATSSTDESDTGDENEGIPLRARLPFRTDLDYGTGRMQPGELVVERRLSDLAAVYADPPAAMELAHRDGDPVVYRAFEAPVPHEAGHLVYRTTVISPGRVGDEFFMTRGHHHVRDAAEVYLGLSGHGWMLMETRAGQACREELRPGTVVYVPPGWAHRTVNDGDRDLVFLAVFPGDAGHDYASLEDTGFAVRAVAGPSRTEFTGSLPQCGKEAHRIDAPPGSAGRRVVGE